MIHIKAIIIISLITLSFTGYSQSELPTSPIELKTFYHNNELKLRWMVVDMDMWQWGQEVGYTIIRTTIEENGTTLSLEDQLDSRVLIVENLKPYTSSEIQSNFQNNDYAEAAGKLLYDNTINDTSMPMGSATFADAIMAEEKKKEAKPSQAVTFNGVVYKDQKEFLAAKAKGFK